MVKDFFMSANFLILSVTLLFTIYEGNLDSANKFNSMTP